MRSGKGEERGGAGGAEGRGRESRGAWGGGEGSREVIRIIICIFWLLRQYNNSNRSRIFKHKRGLVIGNVHFFVWKAY